MSDIEDQDHHEAGSATPAGGRKRFTMKSLGALVDSNRITSATMPDRPETTGPRPSATEDDEAVIVEDVEHVEDVEDDVDDVTDADVATAGSDEPIDEAPPAPRETVAEVEEATIELRDEPGGPGDADGPSQSFADDEFRDDDGIDRSDMGTQVTRTGLAGLVGATTSYDTPADAAMSTRLASAQPLARQILDEEIAPGGRLSDPRDVPGIVLSLAKELPAAAAVSVVRIDEEIELVGNSIHPDVDPSMLARVFSGVFRTMQVAAGVLADGPLGTVHDVVIEGEHMDLILRPLGPHYYLMVLEDRRSPSANLKATRLRMATLAPGLAAILAHDYGEV